MIDLAEVGAVSSVNAAGQFHGRFGVYLRERGAAANLISVIYSRYRALDGNQTISVPSDGAVQTITVPSNYGMIFIR